METPDTKADRLIEQFVAEALGPIDAYHQSVIKDRIWRVVNEEKEAIAKAKEEEE